MKKKLLAIVVAVLVVLGVTVVTQQTVYADDIGDEPSSAPLCILTPPPDRRN